MNQGGIVRSGTRLIGMVVLLIAAIAAGSAAADEGKTAPFAGHVKFEKYHVDYDVNPDGTYTLVHDTLVNVLSEEGVKVANHTGFSYSESLEEAEVLWAYTLKKDGRRIDAPPANIQDREAVGRGGPMFSDIKAKEIIFPDVAVGDKVAYSYKLVRKTALYPGHFSMLEVFTKFVVFEDTKIRVSVPLNSLDLKVHAGGVQGGRTEDVNGRMQWVWTYENLEIATPEIGSVDPVDYGPQIVVSSFKDYGAIAAVYEDRARPKAQVTDKIRSLAKELTAGVSEPREQAKILYNWIAKNINFAGNYMGVGSVVPHEADLVLANRLGDCKDHVVLFQALLTAVGIESTPVMINSGLSYKLPQVASPRIFDHIITYIPAFDLYVDPSSEFTPFGQLPPGEYGKPVVHTSNYDGPRQTPLMNHKDQTSMMKMVLHIKEDGSADAEVKAEEKGITSMAAKASMARIQPNVEDLVVRGVLQRRGLTGTGTIEKADPLELADGYTYGLKCRIDNAMNLPGPGGYHINPLLPSMHPISEVLAGLNLPERTLDFACMGDISTEEYTLHFPKNIKITALPKDVHLSNSNVRYDSTYRQEGNTVTVVRRYEDWTKGPVCPPQDDKDFRPIAQDILKDLKAQLIYQPADDAAQ